MAISAVVATLNEEEGVGRTLEEIRKILYDPHLIAPDGNIVDTTVFLAENVSVGDLLHDGKGDDLFQVLGD